MTPHSLATTRAEHPDMNRSPWTKTAQPDTRYDDRPDGRRVREYFEAGGRGAGAASEVITATCAYAGALAAELFLQEVEGAR